MNCILCDLLMMPPKVFMPPKCSRCNIYINYNQTVFYQIDQGVFDGWRYYVTSDKSYFYKRGGPYDKAQFVCDGLIAPTSYDSILKMKAFL